MKEVLYLSSRTNRFLRASGMLLLAIGTVPAISGIKEISDANAEKYNFTSNCSIYVAPEPEMCQSKPDFGQEKKASEEIFLNGLFLWAIGGAAVSTAYVRKYHNNDFLSAMSPAASFKSIAAIFELKSDIKKINISQEMITVNGAELPTAPAEREIN